MTATVLSVLDKLDQNIVNYCNIIATTKDLDNLKSRLHFHIESDCNSINRFLKFQQDKHYQAGSALNNRILMTSRCLEDLKEAVRLSGLKNFDNESVNRINVIAARCNTICSLREKYNIAVELLKFINTIPNKVYLV